MYLCLSQIYNVVPEILENTFYMFVAFLITHRQRTITRSFHRYLMDIHNVDEMFLAGQKVNRASKDTQIIRAGF